MARLVEVTGSRDQSVGSYIVSQHHTSAYSASRQRIVTASLQTIKFDFVVVSTALYVGDGSM